MLSLGFSWSCQQAPIGGEIACLSMKVMRRINGPTEVCCGYLLSALGRLAPNGQDSPVIQLEAELATARSLARLENFSRETRGTSSPRAR